MDGAMDAADGAVGPLPAAASGGDGAIDSSGNALMEILMDDEDLDTMAELSETPVAAQISHSQIIEKQAHSIAKLEKHAERAKEYKTLTKVKLKEAALRLREYRLKVEALMGEVEALKKVQQANEKKIKTMEKKSGVQQIETLIEEEPAVTGRGKGGRGRGRGGRGRGRGQGSVAAAASSEPVVSVDNDEQKAAAVETKSIGTQAEDVKSYTDAAAQTMEADRVETAEVGVQTQAEETKKRVDSDVQTTISGEIQVVTAPVESISAGLQTDALALMESSCQCDLLPAEEISADRIEVERSSQVSSSRRVGSRSRSADEVAMVSAISRKRKRSFESTTGRGEQPILSALLATAAKELLSTSDNGTGAVVQTQVLGADVMLVDGEASFSIQTGASNVVEKEVGLATEKQRERVQEESKLAPLQSVALGEGVSAVMTAEIDAGTLPPNRVDALEATAEVVNFVDSPQSRILNNEAATSAHKSPIRKLARVETSALDAIGAAIDAELDFSDSDEEEAEDREQGSALVSSQLERDESATSQAALQFSAVAAAAFHQIDSEVDFGSNCDGEMKRPGTCEAVVAMPGHLMVNDAISSAIDDELMTSDDDEEHQNQASTLTAAVRPSAFSVSINPISAAIDDDLADSSDDEGDEKRADGDSAIQENGAAVSAAIDDELASSSDEGDEQGVSQAADMTNSVTRDPISAAIDDELASSSDEEIESEAFVTSQARPFSVNTDPNGDAINDGLTSSDDEEGMDSHTVSQLDVKPFSLTNDPISAAIDDELASSSNEEDTEVETDRLQGEPVSENKDLVASTIDEELCSSSDDEIDSSTSGATAAASVANDPIGASIDDELASNSEDEELGNHTDEPSPASNTEISDPVTITDESARCHDDDRCEHQEEEVPEKTQPGGSSLLMTMLSRRSEKGAVVSTVATFSSTEKRLVEAAIDDELASSSDEEPKTPISDGSAAIRVTKKTANDEVKSAHIGEAPVGSLASPPASFVEILSRDSDGATARVQTTVKGRPEEEPTPFRSSQVKTETVKCEDSDLGAFVVKKDGTPRSKESILAARDLLAAIGKPSLSLSSSSDSSDSDSSDSSTDSDGEQSEGDFGIEYQTEVADVDASMEAEPGRRSPQIHTTSAQPVEDKISVSGEKQRLESPVRLQKTHVGDIEVPEKPPLTVASRASDTDKHDTYAALKQHDAKSGSTSSDEEGEIQTSPKKRRRTLLSDTTEIQVTQQKGKSSVTESSPVKRQKLHADDSLAENTDATASKRENIVTVEADTVSLNEMPTSVPSPAPVQPKRDPCAKPLINFQRSIAHKGEKMSDETEPTFVARTLLVLLKTSALHAISKPILLNKLCDALTASYREKEISPMLLVQETCRMLQLPKVRQMMEKGGLSACFVAHKILLGLVGVPIIDQEDDTEVHMVAEAEKNQLTECLVYLRSLLLVGRDHLARDANLLTPPEVSRTQQLQWTRLHKSPVSHDKVFLAHVCSFYARICKSIGFGEAINVLLFDMLRWNPSIKGLFFTRTIVEVAPEVLRSEFDAQDHLLPVLLKTTICHVLALINKQSAHKQERLLGVSSMQLMHHIAESIHADSLLQVNAEASAYRESFAAMLWDEHIVPLAKQDRADDVHEKDVVFEICKSLELLSAVYMQWQMMELYPVAHFQGLFAKSELPRGRAAVVKMAGTIAVAFAVSNRVKRLKSKEIAESESSHASMENANYDSSSGDYVLRVFDWLQQLLTQEAGANQLEVQLTSAFVCIELISESAATRERRHKVLRDVLQWFKRQPQEQQMRFPGAFLRQLRLLTLSTRPIVKAS